MGYGSIDFYYRDSIGRGSSNSNSNTIFTVQKSRFSPSDLDRIAALKNQIPALVITDFDAKYLAWKNTWSRPEIAIHSNPYFYARSTEYESLLEYSMKYGSGIIG